MIEDRNRTMTNIDVVKTGIDINVCFGIVTIKLCTFAYSVCTQFGGSFEQIRSITLPNQNTFFYFHLIGK